MTSSQLSFHIFLLFFVRYLSDAERLSTTLRYLILSVGRDARVPSM